MTQTHKQLGDFLRSRRERLRPEQIGLTVTRRRRTPGLRREEVASAAGISAEWYVKLEQGRAVTPSSTTIDALARALCLNEVDRAHLCTLARINFRPHFVREEVPASVQRVIDDFNHAAYVTGQRWDVLAWNEPAADLLTDFGQTAIDKRNILLYMFTDPRARVLFGEGWTHEAQRMIALFRSIHDLWADDLAFVDLVERLHEGCAEFEAWWTTHDIGAAVPGKKTLYHPTRGRLCFEYTSFQTNEDSRLKLAVYIPG